MEENVSASDTARLDELRRHRAELRESMSALEDALAAPAAADRSRWARRVQAALAEVSGDFRAHVDLTEGPHGLYGDVLRTVTAAVRCRGRPHAGARADRRPGRQAAGPAGCPGRRR